MTPRGAGRKSPPRHRSGKGLALAAIALMLWSRSAVAPARAVDPRGIGGGSPLEASSPRFPDPAPPRLIARFDLPVAFQLTRPRRLGALAASITETYRETWELEVRAGGLMTLRSSRATAVAYGAGTVAGSPDAVTTPVAVWISEGDFSRLVGLSSPAAESDEWADGRRYRDSSSERMIYLSLSRSTKLAGDLVLLGADDEHFAVHIDAGGNVAL